MVNYIETMKNKWENNKKVHIMIEDLEFWFKVVNNELYRIEYIAKNKALEYSQKIINNRKINIWIT